MSLTVVPITTGFSTGFLPARGALLVLRLLILRRGLLIVLGRRRLLAHGLDAAQGAAEFLDFAFIGEFLALGHFDEFEDFLELIEGVLQFLGNLGGVENSEVDSRGIGGAEIDGAAPLTLLMLMRRRRLLVTLGALGRTFVAFLTFRAFAALLLVTFLIRFLTGRLGVGRRFNGVLVGRFKGRFDGGWFGGDIARGHGFLGVRFAETAGGIHLRLSRFWLIDGFAGVHGRLGHARFGPGSRRSRGEIGGVRLPGHGQGAGSTAAATTAAATATSAAATWGGSARRGG